MKANGKRMKFQVSIQTNDTTGQVVAVYFLFRSGKAATTKELADGNAQADYDAKGRLLGVEMLAPCKVEVLNQLTEDATVRRFVRNTMPRPQQWAVSAAC
jgi:uncharacterized protein YuzE